ncbi:hypothetical protein EV356DRAFT_560196 [Viridothelium virens]|uniref:SnoaL-like domain-containing protein n=1 Tax=Viridothelium virens TaxID=1048519 RepID=A0A6A6H4Q5_VIRVR|nr:hypothetical protein EV356DRAFT_560196 [Viridothelium virens]
MPAATEIQKQSIEEFISGWKSWNPSTFLDTLSSDCTQTALPFNSGKPTRSRAELEQLFPILMSTLSKFELTIHNVVHEPTKSQAALYSMAEADTPFGPYKNEQAVFLWLNEEGKVSKIEEMFDSAFMNEFLPKLQQYMAQKSQEQT